MTSDLTCPECGERLPADAPRGLCPACLLKAGLASDTSEALDPVEVTSTFLGPARGGPRRGPRRVQPAGPVGWGRAWAP